MKLLLLATLFLSSCVTYYEVHTPEADVQFLAVGNTKLEARDGERSVELEVDSNPDSLLGAAVDIAKILVIPSL